jgi:AraC-like DNA-binding protein
MLSAGSLTMSQFLFPPGVALASCVDNILIGSAPDGDADLQLHFPASVRPRLVLTTRGGASLVKPAGGCTPLPAAYVAPPKALPRKYIVKAGSEFIIVIFRAGSFTQFFDSPLNEFPGWVIPLEDLVPLSECRALMERLLASDGTDQLLDITRRFLLDARRNVVKRALYSLPHVTTEQLTLATSAIAAAVDLSGRQFERRFLANYGMSLRDYRRLVRYMTALNLVLTRPWQPGLVTRIAQDSGYFDQAHFIRDFREFVGRPPGDFIKNNMAEDPENKYWKSGTYNIHG